MSDHPDKGSNFGPWIKVSNHIPSILVLNLYLVEFIGLSCVIGSFRYVSPPQFIRSFLDTNASFLKVLHNHVGVFNLESLILPLLWVPFMEFFIVLRFYLKLVEFNEPHFLSSRPIGLDINL